MIKESCKVLVDTKDCVKQFERYQWLSEISDEKRGAEGFIFFVYNKELGKESVLKINLFRSVIESDKKELEITCLVSGFPSFVTLYNSWICNVYPDDDIWQLSEAFYKLRYRQPLSYHKASLSYLEIEKCVGSLKDLLNNKKFLSEYDVYCIAFELTNGYLYAIQQLNFNHGDVHTGNILYNYDNDYRQYNIETVINKRKRERLVVDCKSIYYPKWADFGRSSVGGEKKMSISYQIYGLITELGVKHGVFSWEQLSDEQLLKWLGNKVNELDPDNKKQKIQ